MAIDPYELFCAYHLGLDRRGEARFLNLHQVARDFGVGPEEIRAALDAHGLSPAHVIERDFDFAGAQADIAVEADPERRQALARAAWAAFRQAEGSARDWARELEEARREAEDESR